MKTNKSVRTRLRVTKKGVVLGRGKGSGHFKAKEPRSKQLNRKGYFEQHISKKLRQTMLTNINHKS